jgi:hypothetical protein
MCRSFTTSNDVNHPTALLPHGETVCWARPGSEGPPDRAQHVGEGLSRPLVANACLSELLNMLSLRTGANIVYIRLSSQCEWPRASRTGHGALQ